MDVQRREEGVGGQDGVVNSSAYVRSRADLTSNFPILQGVIVAAGLS
ncbi:hypothetical protein ABZR86_20970 [Dyella marensis]|jgi:hypothetical protein|nr:MULTISPECIES: hypothetical protein [Dyella]